MEIRLSDLLAVYDALERLSTPQYKVKTGYQIGKVFRAVHAEKVDFENARIELAKKYGTLSEGGQQYQFTPTNSLLFNGEFLELLNTVVDLPIKPPLIDDNEVRINGKDAALLSDFFQWGIIEEQEKTTDGL